MSHSPENPKVCAVMCTYGRFDIVRQSITMFLAQDYDRKKLVIFNTAETPLVLSDSLSKRGDVEVVNQGAQINGEPFTCLGDVRNSSLAHAEGDLYICWDDDDLFMPWHITQCVEHYLKTPDDVQAWKPDISYISTDGGASFKGVMGNSMEASFVVDMGNVKRLGFSTKRSGAEHVDGGWLSQSKVSDGDVSPFESYGYVWGDERAAHKTSGHIDQEGNFGTHKTNSVDFGEQPLEPHPLTIMDKFFRAALGVWANPELHEMSNHSASREKVEELRGKMKSFYGRFFLPVPSFLERNTNRKTKTFGPAGKFSEPTQPAPVIEADVKERMSVEDAVKDVFHVYERSESSRDKVSDMRDVPDYMFVKRELL